MAEDQIVNRPEVVEKEAGIGLEGKAMQEAILKHGLDADEAMKAFVGREGEQIALDEATNRRLLRKIDFNILPVRQGDDGSSSDSYL